MQKCAFSLNKKSVKHNNHKSRFQCMRTAKDKNYYCETYTAVKGNKNICYFLFIPAPMINIVMYLYQLKTNNKEIYQYLLALFVSFHWANRFPYFRKIGKRDHMIYEQQQQKNMYFCTLLCFQCQVEKTALVRYCYGGFFLVVNLYLEVSFQ